MAASGQIYYNFKPIQLITKAGRERVLAELEQCKSMNQNQTNEVEGIISHINSRGTIPHDIYVHLKVIFVDEEEKKTEVGQRVRRQKEDAFFKCLNAYYIEQQQLARPHSRSLFTRNPNPNVATQSESPNSVLAMLKQLNSNPAVKASPAAGSDSGVAAVAVSATTEAKAAILGVGIHGSSGFGGGPIKPAASRVSTGSKLFAIGKLIAIAFVLVVGMVAIFVELFKRKSSPPNVLTTNFVPPPKTTLTNPPSKKEEKVAAHHSSTAYVAASTLTEPLDAGVNEAHVTVGAHQDLQPQQQKEQKKAAVASHSSAAPVAPQSASRPPTEPFVDAEVHEVRVIVGGPPGSSSPTTSSPPRLKQN